MDWTENALLALFFCVIENSGKDDKVWILQPSKLNIFTIQKLVQVNEIRIIPLIYDIFEKKKLINVGGKLRPDELTRRYLRMDFISEELNNVYLLLAVYPPFLEERMASQKACFTIFGNKIYGFLELVEKNKILDSIIIGGTKKDAIPNELRLIGIDFVSILPDLDGIGKSIQARFNGKFYDNRETIGTILNKFSNLNKD